MALTINLFIEQMFHEKVNNSIQRLRILKDFLIVRNLCVQSVPKTLMNHLSAAYVQYRYNEKMMLQKLSVLIYFILVYSKPKILSS